jgi:hypothetical protein
MACLILICLGPQSRHLLKQLCLSVCNLVQPLLESVNLTLQPCRPVDPHFFLSRQLTTHYSKGGAARPCHAALCLTL